MEGGLEMFLTFKYRLLPTAKQHAALHKILEDQRHLYNAALQERIDCYVKTGSTRTRVDQFMALAEWRQSDPDAASVPSNLQRWTISRVDDAYRAFFRRVKSRNRKSGFPRFRGVGRWRTFGFSEFTGIRFDGKRLRFKGMPSGLRVHLHRQMPDGKILGCSITRDGRQWFICFKVRILKPTQKNLTSAIGIDVGLERLATLSTGEQIPNHRPARKAEKELRRRQRALSRCKRASRSRDKAKERVIRLHRKIANTRKTYLHQISANLVRRFGLIAVEKLNVKGMAGSRFAKSIHDASWGHLKHMLHYKAERAGGLVVEVNPRNTSQACSGCGVIVQKDISQRVHQCHRCEIVLNRDHNAALNILHLGVAVQGALKQTGRGEAVLGNITGASASDTLPTDL